LGEPNVQFDHLDELFNMAMSNLAFANVYNGFILYPYFTILVDAPFSVDSCIFWHNPAKHLKPPKLVELIR